MAKAYFEVLRAQDNLEFVRAEKRRGRQLEQTKQRFEVGLSAITDVHDAQAQFDGVLADEVLAENSLTNSYEALREITGQEYSKLAVLDTKRFAASRTTESSEALIEKRNSKIYRCLLLVSVKMSHVTTFRLPALAICHH